MLQLPRLRPSRFRSPGPGTDRRRPHGLPPVQWLSVAQLGRTAVEVVQASMFARFADEREAMANTPKLCYALDRVADDTDVWIDYVADTGDGFDATFATARCIAGAPDVSITDRVGGEAAFPGRGARADLLVLGGDEVYPVASAAAYTERLNRVLERATRAAGRTPGEANPPVLALPGNHDWYDSLASFRRNFCEAWVQRRPEGRSPELISELPHDDIGGWDAFQSRSYFAVRLRPGWWLWGLDSQLDAPFDAEQLAYFRDARDLLEPDDDIVLCTATPCWLEAGGQEVYEPEPDTPLYTLLSFVDRILAGDERHRIRLVLTGDQHHYARYSSPAGPDLVTCGGGGAFLASTHHLPETLEISWPEQDRTRRRTAYTLETEYPSRERSRELLSGGRFLAAGWSNGVGFPLFLGGVDFVLFLLGVHTFRLRSVPGWWLWLSLLVVGMVFLLILAFAARGASEHLPGVRTRYTLGLALPHAAAHFALAGVPAWFVARSRPPGWYLLPVFAASCVLATLLVVTYLRIADRRDCHTLEAYSGLHISDYKCHLRLQLGPELVRVHVVGIDRVPRTRHVPDPETVPLHARIIETFEVASRRASR
ncbi:MAG TPA: hypothetical protein VGH99_04255 [Pseudonocardia sp.]|jgi:hypothetical protein